MLALLPRSTVYQDLTYVDFPLGAANVSTILRDWEQFLWSVAAYMTSTGNQTRITENQDDITQKRMSKGNPITRQYLCRCTSLSCASYTLRRTLYTGNIYLHVPNMTKCSDFSTNSHYYIESPHCWKCCQTCSMHLILPDEMSGNVWALCQTSVEVCRTCPAFSRGLLI